MNTARISIKEKFSYGLGDTGCNLVWQTVMLFMAWFYTDVFGLSPAHMGLLNVLYAGFRLYRQADLRLCFLYLIIAGLYGD